MAKYLEHDGAGSAKEVQPINTSGGAGDAGKMIQLDAAGRLAETMMPVGITADTASIVASEALSAGNFVNIWNDTGTAKVRKADASANMPCHGFILAGVSLGNIALVYFEGSNTQLSGMTPGTKQFLSDVVPGNVIETVPTGTGKLVQILGKSYSATELTFEKTNPIELV